MEKLETIGDVGTRGVVNRSVMELYDRSRMSASNADLRRGRETRNLSFNRKGKYYVMIYIELSGNRSFANKSVHLEPLPKTSKQNNRYQEPTPYSKDY